MNDGQLFDIAYAQTNRAAEVTEQMATDGGNMQAKSKELVRLLTEALCAARELDNRLAGNPAPKRGD